MHFSTLYTTFYTFSLAYARDWYDTGSGAIVLEEAWLPEALNTGPQYSPDLRDNSALRDIHNQRLQLMNENNIDFMVLSCVSPCIQGISDPRVAADTAVMINNELATSISNMTVRFGAFAALAMHNATVAAQELNRTVTELGFQGALVNDYQQSGSDNATLLFYDQPEYDVFWQMASDLNVPVYFHPRRNIAQIFNLLYQHAPYLQGTPQEFSATLSTHVLGLCTNGVFDRFPNVKVIVGHLGERIPSDLMRIDERLLLQRENGLPMLRNVSSYWRTNVFETTSANFATSLLRFHSQIIGLDRILFSIDYPFASIPEGTAWLNSLEHVLNQTQLDLLRRGTAIKVLGLNDD